MLRLNISGITIITVKYADYHCIIHNISKSEAINLLKILFLKIVNIDSQKNIFINFSGFKAVFF